jgi:uncharacterized phage protein (TIGR02218 family)
MSDYWRERLTTLAFCWRLDRRDGVTLGFTSHDRDLAIDGIVYRAAPGMLPSAIKVDGFAVDTLDVSGALTDAAITEADLAVGRWDGAAVRLFAVDWSAPAASPLHLTRGVIGDVGIEDGKFTAELLGPTAILERPVCEQTSPECRAELGDRRCGVDLAPRTRLVRVMAVADAVSITVDGDEPIGNAYGYGSIRWIDGPNSGLHSAIRSSSGATIVLRAPAPFNLASGTTGLITAGCDKLFETCRGRFANAANFRGEPHLPGNDLLMRYPGS